MNLPGEKYLVVGSGKNKKYILVEASSAKGYQPPDMGKNKKKNKKGKQLSQNLKPLPKQGTQNLQPLPTTSDAFQAPHHKQESMVELSDDTSPVPVTGIGNWKTINSSLNTNAKPGTTSTNTAANAGITKQENLWIDFKNSFSKVPKQINKIGIKTKQDIYDQMKTRFEAEQKNKQEKKTEGSEIKWELNVIDDKDISTESTDRKQKDASEMNVHKPQLQTPVKGTASQIMLIQGKNKPVVMTTKNTPTQKTIKQESVNKKNKVPVSTTSAPAINTPHLHSDKPLYLQDTHSYSYPKGVPRSFLKQQNGVGAIQPQDQTPPPSKPNWKLAEPFSGPQVTGLPLPGLYIPPNNPVDSPDEQQYSPSDVYDDINPNIEQAQKGSESPEGLGQKRLSAFRRLGPVSQPKKPKLTISLLCSKDQSVRAVQEDNTVEEEKYTPVHLRKEIMESTDEIVSKFLPHWPWRRNVPCRKHVTHRTSKSVMILEQEQMEEVYDKENVFVQVTVKGYPPSWKKEDVLDVILDGVKGKSFIPCFTEFTPEECKFLVIRSRAALLTIHKLGFYIRKDDVELNVTISQTDLSLKQLDFIPRLVLRKQLATGYDGERKLSLKDFTLKSDISHFIYFPLNRITNQTELVQLQSVVAWDYLTDLDLSHNRLTSIDSFELPKTTPRLKHLDLSYNYLEKVTSLLYSRELSLKSIKLEGNPLCHDYTDPGHYVRVIKMMFTGLTEIDGMPIHLKGDTPKPKRNYCPSEAVELVSKFLETFFPLLELPEDERDRVADLYDEKAVLTVTYRYNLRYSPIHRKFRNIFLRARAFDEGDMESIEGAANIARLIAKWPGVQHDPYTFTVDVIHHNESSTILRIDGILKLTSESLADDEYLLSFTRTLVLTTLDGIEYKILNEMVYWDEPCREAADLAFQINTIRTAKRLSLKLESPPDEDLKKNLVDVFMKITDLDKRASEKCLELKEWNLKNAIEYYMKLVKLDDLDSLRKELEADIIVK